MHTVVIKNHYSDVNYNAFSQMRTFIVAGDLNHKIWKALATCTCLQTIMIYDDMDDDKDDMDGDKDEDDIISQHYSVTFPNLEILSINASASSPNFIISLFQNTTMPALRTLDVEVLPSSDAADQAARRDVLESVCDRSPMLKEVRISGRMSGYDEVP
ncbi:hypothetical protein FRB98_003114 [Tulasnella sp. 332]|nr:hypothetical protein FRB98_003114 [Tulasnella sp. 332]